MDGVLKLDTRTVTICFLKLAWPNRIDDRRRTTGSFRDTYVIDHPTAASSYPAASSCETQDWPTLTPVCLLAGSRSDEVSVNCVVVLGSSSKEPGKQRLRGVHFRGF